MEKERVKLTQFAKSAGCAAKLSPQILAEVVGKLPRFQDKNLLVGVETSDDAAVYRLSKELAVIQTLDFFPPMVDEPYTFGQIAAANALSDIYAMGGEPKLALNIVAYPNCLGPEVLGDILAGGADKVKEAGAVLAGGHSIHDEEPKYGMAVTGFVHPEKIWKNQGARPNDVLILTKSLGTGLVNTAVKAEMASEFARKKAIQSMATLNKKARDVFQEFPIHCCTDVTGFSLAGHGLEIARASDVTLEIWADRLPLLPEALNYAAMGLVPEGTYRNKCYQKPEVLLEGGIEESMEDLIFDPQTSGGLLISVEETYADAILEALKKKEMETPFAVIGRVLPKQEASIKVRKAGVEK